MAFSIRPMSIATAASLFASSTFASYTTVYADQIRSDYEDEVRRRCYYDENDEEEEFFYPTIESRSEPYYESIIDQLKPDSPMASKNGEELMPGLVYVALSGFSGSIIARQRNILVRIFSPLAFATAAGALFLPNTTHKLIESITGPSTPRTYQKSSTEKNSEAEQTIRYTGTELNTHAHTGWRQTMGNKSSDFKNGADMIVSKGMTKEVSKKVESNWNGLKEAYNDADTSIRNEAKRLKKALDVNKASVTRPIDSGDGIVSTYTSSDSFIDGIPDSKEMSKESKIAGNSNKEHPASHHHLKAWTERELYMLTRPQYSEYWSNGDEIGSANIRDANYYNYIGSFSGSSLGRSSWWSSRATQSDQAIPSLKEREEFSSWESNMSTEHASNGEMSNDKEAAIQDKVVIDATKNSKDKHGQTLMEYIRNDLHQIKEKSKDGVDSLKGAMINVEKTAESITEKVQDSVKLASEEWRKSGDKKVDNISENPQVIVDKAHEKIQEVDREAGYSEFLRKQQYQYERRGADRAI